MNIFKYRNFINNDPILDLLVKQEQYKPDNLLPGFDEDLLLENYIKKNKKEFCSKIYEDFGNSITKIAADAFVMKTEDLCKYFRTGEYYRGNNYSLFTVEYSTISVLKDGSTSKSHKFYNFKNWMHVNECRYSIDHSFIIGRKYTGSSGKAVYSEAFDFLAERTCTFDELLIEADHHINNFHKLKIGVDVFPNMKNTSDFPFHNAKKLIATEIGELTCVKGISVNDRNEMIKEGITSYSQLSLERSTKVFENFNDLELQELTENTIFIDYEILTSIYDDFTTFPKSNTKNLLFNIGCVTQEYEKSFVAHSFSQEKGMISDFINYLNNLPGDDVTFVHWTNIEERVFNEKLKEYPSIKLTKKVKWFDLHDYFVKSDIYVKDCYDYKLKNVSRVFEKHGFIKSKWDKAGFLDGLGAMVGYIKYLRTGEKDIIDNIVYYNLVDCKVMLEIYQALLSVKLTLPIS
jgi:hypothetical protein